MAYKHDIDSLVKGLHSGIPYKDLAATHGISRERVRQIAIKLEIPNKRIVDEEVASKIIVEDVNKGLTYSQICDKFSQYSKNMIKVMYKKHTGANIIDVIIGKRDEYILSQFAAGKSATKIIKELNPKTKRGLPNRRGNINTINSVYLINAKYNNPRLRNGNSKAETTKLIKIKRDKDGLNFKEIAKWLTKQGYKTYGGKDFSRETVRLYYANSKQKKVYKYFDIIVTVPAKVKWSDYEKELEAVKDGTQVINYKVNAFPKTKIGKRCYIVHNGFVRGWMEIVGLATQDFTCTTTGKEWKGKFIQRSGEFHPIEPIPMRGFQGFRYYK